MDQIDLVVGVYGFDDRVEELAAEFFGTLRDRCDLSGVNVFCAERAHCPLTQVFKDRMHPLVDVRTCPLPPASNSCDDTAQFSDWMVQNVGSAPWVTVAHYDVTFNGDYITWLRGAMGESDMVGRHHDGLVSIRRSAYAASGVGFARVDNLEVYRDCNGQLHVVPRRSPRSANGTTEPALCMDVGDLLDLRVETLGLRHTWHARESDPADFGKSDLFTHHRNGSGH